MRLSPALKQRAGVLMQVAERFIERWQIGDGQSAVSPREGLVALCRTCERFIYLPEVDDDTERTFVEGAGALLAVLLIQHIESACHVAQGGVHRVRLGAHGFFDPFQAVEQVLDAQDVRLELRRQVELAEAEARAQGPLSRVVSALAAALQKERPDLHIEQQFDHTLSLRSRLLDEPMQMDLRRAVETTRDQDLAAVENVTRRLLSLLPGAPAEERLEQREFQGRLLPRLARADAVRDLSVQGKSVLLTRPLCEELVVALLLEYQGRARYVRAREIEQLTMSADETFALALDNLRARSERARIVREQLAQGPTLVARTGDGRDSARVLLPELYDQLCERLGPAISIAVPHRDTFLACTAQEPALVERLAERARDDAARAPHALSAQVYRLTERGLC